MIITVQSPLSIGIAAREESEKSDDRSNRLLDVRSHWHVLAGGKNRKTDEKINMGVNLAERKTTSSPQNVVSTDPSIDGWTRYLEQ